MRIGRWIMGVIAVLSAMAGCEPALIGQGPFPAMAPGQQNGLRYYLGKDVVIVEVEVTDYVEIRVVELKNSGLAKTKLGVETISGFSPSKATVSLKTMADAKNVYVLDIAPRGLKDRSLTVQVGENGLLTSVNVQSKDRTGETLLQIAKGVGVVAGAFLGIPGVRGSAKDLDLPELGFRGKLKADEKERIARRIAALPIEAVYFLQESEPGASLWVEIDRLEQDLIKQKAALLKSFKAACEAPDANGISLAKKQIDLRRDVIQWLVIQLTDAQNAFASALGQFAKGKRLGRTTKERKVLRHLEIKDLPPSRTLLAASSPEGFLNETKIPAALSGFQAMKELYDTAKTVLTFDPEIDIPEKADESPAPPASQDGLKRVRVYYREPIPGFLRIYSLATVFDREKLVVEQAFVKTDEKPVTVLHPGAPIRSVGYDAKAFSSQNLQLTIDARGRIVGLTKAASSAAAGAAEGIAGALTALRDETAATLDKIKSIDQTRREIALNALQSRIDELDKQRALVDNQIALKGTIAGQDLALEKKAIDQQSEYLKSQLALAKLQDTSEADLQGARLAADVEVLRRQVELLKLQIEKLKQEAELAKIRE